MEILAKIIELPTKNDKVFKVKLDNAKTKELCTVREGPFCALANAENVAVGSASCASCSGCSHAESQGLFAVKGDEVLAYNETGSQLQIADVVLVRASKKVQGFQAIIALCLPVLLACLGFALAHKLFHNELLSIVSMFALCAVGVTLAFVFSKFQGINALPKIVKKL